MKLTNSRDIELPPPLRLARPRRRPPRLNAVRQDAHMTDRRNEERGPRPSEASEKMVGNMIELQRPIARNARVRLWHVALDARIRIRAVSLQSQLLAHRWMPSK